MTHLFPSPGPPCPPADRRLLYAVAPDRLLRGQYNPAERPEGGFWTLCNTSGIFYGSTEDLTPAQAEMNLMRGAAGMALLLNPPPLHTAAAQ